MGQNGLGCLGPTTRLGVERGVAVLGEDARYVAAADRTIPRGVEDLLARVTEDVDIQRRMDAGTVR